MPRTPAASPPAAQSVTFAPYLVVRLMPGVCMVVGMPERASMQTLVARAWKKMAKLGQRYRMCLVVSPRRGLYMEPDGTSRWSNEISTGGVQLQMHRLNHAQPAAQPERISQLATAVRSAANCAEENPGANPGSFASSGKMA